MSTTTNLDTLKINYLTQAQYDAAVSGGTIDENALYLTPDSVAVTKVIEQGTGNGWRYRIWSDNTMEMWTTVTTTAKTNRSDGGAYISETNVTPPNFPYEFAEVPVINVNIGTNGVIMTPVSITRASTTSAGSWAGYRVNSNTTTTDKNFYFYVVGTKAS